MHTRRSHHNPNKKASSSGGTLFYRSLFVETLKVFDSTLEAR